MLLEAPKPERKTLKEWWNSPMDAWSTMLYIALFALFVSTAFAVNYGVTRDDSKPSTETLTQENHEANHKMIEILIERAKADADVPR